MASAFITIDAQALLRQADALTRVDAQRLGEVGLAAVNDVAPQIERRAREAIVAGINLDDAYVRARMGVRLGTDPSRPEAVIYSPFKDTPLGRYKPQQLTQAAKNPKRSKGDKLRGIAAGRKAAGVSVEVVRGAVKSIEHGFLMPLRNGNGWGVFTRTRDGLRYQHRLGPAVYQLFRVQADLLADEASTALELAVISEADKMIQELFV